VTIRRIHKLEDNLTNQIAAGEVVERPGSALKELLENSLDAKSKQIQVRLEEGGFKKIEVVDDGVGIHPDDLMLALDRHATSKILSAEDLFKLSTWGFRGEALASIGAVSRLTISSRTEEFPTGREIVCEGGVILSDRSIARPVGTSVTVENLFFNTPARKKFQKSPSAEAGFSAQTFHRAALSCAHIRLDYSNNGSPQFQYAAREKESLRVADVYRSAWKLELEENQLLKLEASSEPLKLECFLLPSNYSIPSSRGILLYVNQRSVKDKLLLQAVTAAAREVIFGNLLPQLALFLTLPPDQVDVNVHPTKAEVRFGNPGHVFAFVRKHLEKALAEDRRSSISPGLVSSPSAQEIGPEIGPETNLSFSFSPPSAPSFSAGLAAAPESYAPSFSMGAAPLNLSLQFLGTLKNTYLVCQDPDGLLLIDQHAAHERVTYERLKKSRLKDIPALKLLIPLQIELSREWLDRLEKDFERFASLGMELDRSSPTLLTVLSLPTLFLRSDGSPMISLSKFFRGLLEEWEFTQSDESFSEALKEKLLEQLASQSCHGSVRAGQRLSESEARALMGQMSETDFSGHCPHGRPTTVRFKWNEIERLFKRIF